MRWLSFPTQEKCLRKEQLLCYPASRFGAERTSVARDDRLSGEKLNQAVDDRLYEEKFCFIL